MAPKSSSPRQPAPPLHLHAKVLLQLPRCPRREGRHKRLQDLPGPGAPPHRAAQADPGLVPPLLDPEWIVRTRSSSRARADLAPRQPRLAVAPASRQPTGALPGLSMEPWSSPNTTGLLSPWSAAAARPYLASIPGPHPRHSRPPDARASPPPPPSLSSFLSLTFGLFLFSSGRTGPASAMAARPWSSAFERGSCSPTCSSSPPAWSASSRRPPLPRAESRHRPPCSFASSESVRSVRIRSTTLVRLLHGFVLRPSGILEFRKHSECEDLFDYVGSSSSWIRSSSKRDLRQDDHFPGYHYYHCHARCLASMRCLATYHLYVKPLKLP